MRVFPFNTKIDTNSKIKKYHQLYNSILNSIQDGSLQEGEKLPSIRELSENTELSKNTVTKAYTELEHDGYLYSENKKGYFVGKVSLAKSKEILPVQSSDDTEDIVPTVEHILEQNNTQQEEPSPFSAQSDIFALLHEVTHTTRQNTTSVTKNSDSIQTVSIESLLLKSYQNVLCTHTDLLYQKKEAFGQFPFRKALADFLYRFFKIHTTPEQIIVSSSAEHLLSDILALKSLSAPFIKSDGIGLLRLATQFTEGSINTVRPVVAVRKNTHPLLQKKFLAKNISVCEIDLDTENANLVLTSNQATIVFLQDVPSFPVQKESMFSWAKQCSYRYIIEYSTTKLCKNQPKKSYKQFDTEEKILYINSFETLLFNGLNAAFAVLPLDICADFQQHYDYFSCSLSLLEQYALTDLITSRDFIENFITM